MPDLVSFPDPLGVLRDDGGSGDETMPDSEHRVQGYDKG